LHSGQSARILVESIPVGWIGALHPHWQDELGLTNEVFLFELCVTSLLGKLNKKDVPQYHSLSKFPLIRRDLSLLVAEEVSAAEIKKAVEDCIHKAWLKSMDIFDVYKGDLGVKGKKSIAISLCLQAPDRTLVEAEIQDTMNNLMNILKLKLDITLRE
jgi:phenylalanyl-tRNA synthetase beta chain